MKLANIEWSEAERDEGTLYSVTATDLDTGKIVDAALYHEWDHEPMTLVAIRNKLLGILEHEERK